MRRLLCVLFLVVLVVSALPLLATAPAAHAQGETKTITILETSDLHGNLMPWDYYAKKLNDR